MTELIYGPSVYLVGTQEVNVDDLRRFLAKRGAEGWTTDAPSAGEVLAEVGGRTCYQSWRSPRPGGNEAYLHHLLESGHGSCIEHAVYGILIEGVSRSLTHEMIRHRVGLTPSELSQRYVDESQAAAVVPPCLEQEVKEFMGEKHELSDSLTDEERREMAIAGREWVEGVRIARQKYLAEVGYLTRKAKKLGYQGTDARKYARQGARSVLPESTETKIYWTGNARAWRNFLEQRGSRFADLEIQRLAITIWDVLRQVSPNLFGDFELVSREYGSQELVTQWRKV